MNTLTFLHVLLIIVGVALTMGPGIGFGVIAASGDAGAIRGALRLLPLQTIGVISFVLGVLFGFGLASSMGVSLTAMWLIVSYVCVAAVLVIWGALMRPRGERLRKAADAGDAALVKEAQDPLGRTAGTALTLLLAVIIAMMVFRPA